MEKNIFENAYFGKAYKTRDGRKAIYLYDYKCWIENDRDYTEYYSDGKWFQANIEHCLDIVSEWQEEINEEELDRLAMIKYPCNCSPNETYCDCCINPDLKEAFKTGYRLAVIDAALDYLSNN